MMLNSMVKKLPSEIESISYFDKSDTLANDYNTAVIKLRGEKECIGIFDADMYKNFTVGKSYAYTNPIKSLMKNKVEIRYIHGK